MHHSSELKLKPHLKDVGIPPIDGRFIPVHHPGVDIIEHNTGVPIEIPVETGGQIDLRSASNFPAIEVHIGEA